MNALLARILGRRRYERWLDKAAQAMLDHFSDLVVMPESERDHIPQEELLAGARAALVDAMKGVKARVSGEVS